MAINLMEKASMNKAERAKLEKFLTTYFKEIHKIYTDGDFREESFYPSFNYMKVAKAIRLTIEIQERIDDVYRKIGV